MPKDYGALPPNQIRRSDREKDEAWIKQMLHTAPHAAIATSFEGRPFINSNLFVYDEAAHALFFHTAHVGRTRSNIEKDHQICLSVFDMGRLLPAAEALEFSVEYTGVVVFGRVSVVESEQDAIDALQQLLDKYAPHLHPGTDYRPPVPEELKRTSVFRIDIESWSGKMKKAEEAFPGAFDYDPGPASKAGQDEPDASG